MWPDTTATRQVATWAKNARKHFGPNAYVFVDFKRFVAKNCSCLRAIVLSVRFLPALCPDAVKAGEECTEADRAGDGKENAKRLDFAWWQVACVYMYHC